MDILLPLLIIIGIIAYVTLLIMEPEKHKVALIILAIFYGIFGGSSNNKKRDK